MTTKSQVVLLGDSLVHHLHCDPDLLVICQPGLSIQHTVDQFDWQCQMHPELQTCETLIFCLGTNDTMPILSMNQLIQKFPNPTVPRLFWILPRQCAAPETDQLIDPRLFLLDPLSEPEMTFQSDGIHPDSHGRQFLFEWLQAFLHSLRFG